jgi:hypothetical protein
MGAALSLPLLSFFALPAFTSYGTSMNILFFTLNWYVYCEVRIIYSHILALFFLLHERCEAKYGVYDEMMCIFNFLLSAHLCLAFY